VNCPDLSQIIETINLGVFVLDADARLVYWNRWLENASGISSTEALDKRVFELFPELETPVFIRNLKSVLSFGNFAYFSQKLHSRLFDLPAPPGSPEGIEHMEQQCVMGPIRENEKIACAYVIVEDVTETVARERRLAEFAMKDALTSAYNRRYFDKRLAEELERCRRYDRCLGLIMLDIDHFKNVNDLYGHQFGDEALRSAVSRWSGTIRFSDMIARYGGEEFCILLPESGPDESLALAERLRMVVSSSDVVYNGQHARITVSGGVAFSRSGDGPDDILHRVDRALYRAKAQGRDRIVPSP
jgi:diguanylate cyclase (GGDEF)-like protein